MPSLRLFVPSTKLRLAVRVVASSVSDASRAMHVVVIGTVDIFTIERQSAAHLLQS